MQIGFHARAMLISFTDVCMERKNFFAAIMEEETLAEWYAGYANWNV